jgi:hypothetical protein
MGELRRGSAKGLETLSSGWGCNSMVEYLPSMCEALDSTHSNGDGEGEGRGGREREKE